MIDLDLRRRFYAEELEAVCKLRSPALVDAFATVPREQFLRPGPWTVLADSDFLMGAGARTRLTPDADPGRVYHNIAVAIDPARQLFNGQPGTLGVWIDALGLSPGNRVLHVGCGLGYYTAVIGQCVGPIGGVVAFEVDEALAAEAKRNLAPFPSIDVRQGDGSERLDDTFDGILVNAGVTHPLDVWLDALAAGGRMVLPLTVAMGPHLGKGVVMVVAKDAGSADAAELSARVLTMVAIYSAVGLRDNELNDRLGKALAGSPMQWQAIKRLRRDEHQPAASRWLHGPSFCFST